MTDRLAELAALEPGWDSYGGRPPDPLALRMARTITTSAPTISPSGDGAVLLRWHEAGVEIELWLEPGMSLHVIFVPTNTARLQEWPMPDEPNEWPPPAPQ